jgi:hypothetical protein
LEVDLINELNLTGMNMIKDYHFDIIFISIS